MTALDLDRLHRELAPRRVVYYPSIDSTMRAAVGCRTGTVVIAGEQLAGQGRHGRFWHSEAGAGIYCSIVLEPTPLLTLALGLAAADAIAQATGIICDLRWPNDLMLGGKKAGGILVQLVDGSAIAGIGINVNQQQFPADLAKEATSLRLETGREACATTILLALIPAIEAFVREDKETILRLFSRASSYASGRRVLVRQPGGTTAGGGRTGGIMEGAARNAGEGGAAGGAGEGGLIEGGIIEGGTIEGTTAGLDPDGFLIVRKDDGTDTLIVAGGVRAAGS